MNTGVTFVVVCLLFVPELAQPQLADRAQMPEFDAASVRHVPFDASYQGRAASLTGGAGDLRPWIDFVLKNFSQDASPEGLRLR
jgi:hypothetical protein